VIVACIAYDNLTKNIWPPYRILGRIGTSYVVFYTNGNGQKTKSTFLGIRVLTYYKVQNYVCDFNIQYYLKSDISHTMMDCINLSM